MARVFSLASLQDALINDFNWRVQEISILRRSIKIAKFPANGVLARAAVPLLYAHWEGYIKISAERYFEFVGKRRIKYSNLKANFWIFANEGAINSLETGSLNLRRKIEIIEEIMGSINATNKKKHSKLISTKSNLNSEVFIDICTLLGIDPELYSVNFLFLDKILVDRRNHIAHGRDIPIDYEDFERDSGKVIALMRQFRTDIENAAIQEKFKAA